MTGQSMRGVVFVGVVTLLGLAFAISTATAQSTLSASPSTIGIGDTTTVTSSSDVSSDLRLKLVFPYPQLTTREECPAPRPRDIAGPGTYVLDTVNASVIFKGCWSGKATVKLLTVSDNTELARVQVEILTPSVSMTGLSSALDKGTNVPFTVTASNLSDSQTYSIEVLSSDGDIRFVSTPGSTVRSPLLASAGDLSGDTSYSRDFTFHACNVGGASVFASVLHGTRTIGLDSQYIRVTEPTDSPAPTDTTAVPTCLTLSLEDDGNIRLDYTGSALGRHFFELYRSETEDETYTRHLTRNDNYSPAYWYTPTQGYYYRARGKSCPERHAVGCDDLPWSEWSNVLHVPNDNMDTVASLIPAPGDVSLDGDQWEIPLDGARWHEFTVKTNKSVRVIVTGGVAEITLANAESRRNICPAEGDEERTRGNNQVFWISGCAAGNGTLELRDSATDDLVVSYPFTVVDSSGEPSLGDGN